MALLGTALWRSRVDIAFHTGIEAAVARGLAITAQFSQSALLARRPGVLARPFSHAPPGLVPSICCRCVWHGQHFGALWRAVSAKEGMGAEAAPLGQVRKEMQRWAWAVALTGYLCLGKKGLRSHGGRLYLQVGKQHRTSRALDNAASAHIYYSRMRLPGPGAAKVPEASLEV
jgi:hypothetical protein